MKRLFFILRTRGAGWDREKTLEEQDGWPAHLQFMDRLAQEGFITLGGPLDGTPNTLLRSEERRVGKECRSRWSPYH